MELSDVMGPGYGPYPKDTFGRILNKTGTVAALGDLLMLDMGNAFSGNPHTSIVLGAATSPFSVAILPATAGMGGLLGVNTIPGYWFGIVTDHLGNAGADLKELRVQFQGVVKKASLTATAATTGLPLVAANGVKTLTAATAAGKKVLGIAWEPNASAVGLFQIWFDGINGFGVGNVTS